MTYNIYFGEKQPERYDEIAKKIKALPIVPDIIFTQEDTSGNMFLKSLNTEFKSDSISYLPEQYGDSSQTVGAYYLSKYQKHIEFVEIYHDVQFHNEHECRGKPRYSLMVKLYDDDFKIANLHAEGGREADRCILIDKGNGLNNVIEHKRQFITNILAKNPDIVCGDFNSVYASNEQLLNKFYEKQYGYFKNIINRSEKNKRELEINEKQKIREMNSIMYSELDSHDYRYAKPVNENSEFTSGLGKTIVDTVWYKSATNKIIEDIEILDFHGGKDFFEIYKATKKPENRTESLSDHNPILFKVKKRIIVEASAPEPRDVAVAVAKAAAIQPAANEKLQGLQPPEDKQLAKIYNNTSLLHDIGAKILTTSKLNDIFNQYVTSKNSNPVNVIRELINTSDDNFLIEFVNYIKKSEEINKSEKYKIIESLMTILNKDYDDLFYIYEFADTTLYPNIKETIKIEKKEADNIGTIKDFISRLPRNKYILSFKLEVSENTKRQVHILNKILKDLLNILTLHLKFDIENKSKESSLIYNYISSLNSTGNYDIFITKLNEFLDITISPESSEIYKKIIDNINEYEFTIKKSKTTKNYIISPPSDDLTLFNKPPNGFVNLGNTCFMNAGLQLFYSHPGFNILIENENLFENINKFCENPKNKLASRNLDTDEKPEALLDNADCSYFGDSKNKEEYNKIIGYIRDKDYVKIHENLQDTLMFGYTKGRQEDANDFLTMFLSFIRIKIIISDTQEPNYHYKDCCILCNKVKPGTDTNYSKTVCEGSILTINTKKSKTMSQLILERCKDEHIEHSDITKQITELPKYLMIHVKRFKFNEERDMYEKDNESIGSCETLDLNHFGNYKLEAVIIHAGSTHGGHYFTYRSSGIHNGVDYYYKLNDDKVSAPLIYDDIKDDVEGKDIEHHNTNGYIFLYTHL